jgi:minor fimbrial subunit
MIRQPDEESDMDFQHPIIPYEEDQKFAAGRVLAGITIFLLCIFFTSASSATEPATVTVSCDGPDGYCQKGGNITVRTIGGGGVTIPSWVSSSPLSLYIGICDKKGDLALLCYGRSLRSTILDAKTTNGATKWSSLLSAVDGTYNLPWTITAGSCVSVYVAQTGVQRFLSYGTTYDDPGYAYCAGNAPPPIPDDYCHVASGTDWNIAFGNVERAEIPTTSGTEQTKALTLSCLGTKAHDFSVKLNMTPTSWSTSQLATSNPDLGIEVTVGGTAAKLGESFAMRVTGSGSKTLGFSVLRNPKIKALDIATGDFTASGTLEVSED